jgi:hypothetical protein
MGTVLTVVLGPMCLLLEVKPNFSMAIGAAYLCSFRKVRDVCLDPTIFLHPINLEEPLGFTNGHRVLGFRLLGHLSSMGGCYQDAWG